MRYAIIEENTGTVVNVVDAPEGYVPGRGLLAVVTESANIGDSYEDGSFLTPISTPVSQQE